MKQENKIKISYILVLIVLISISSCQRIDNKHNEYYSTVTFYHVIKKRDWCNRSKIFITFKIINEKFDEGISDIDWCSIKRNEENATLILNENSYKSEYNVYLDSLSLVLVDIQRNRLKNSKVVTTLKYLICEDIFNTIGSLNDLNETYANSFSKGFTVINEKTKQLYLFENITINYILDDEQINIKDSLNMNKKIPIAPLPFHTN